MAGPKSDCEALLKSASAVAERMLAKHRDFHPFGTVMKSTGDIVAIAAHDDRERPSPADVIDLLTWAFQEGARAGEYKATALAYNGSIALADTEEKSDAIVVALDHRDEYSVIVVIPYRIEGGELALGRTFAKEGAGDIFP